MNDQTQQLIELADKLLNSAISCDEAALELGHYSQVPHAASDLVHFLYHFVADVDIRVKDREYAHLQDDRLRQLIANLVRERSTSP